MNIKQQKNYQCEKKKKQPTQKEVTNNDLNTGFQAALKK